MLRDFFLRPKVEVARSRDIGGPAQLEPVDIAIAKLAKQQHGVVTRTDLLDLGLGQDAIDHRARTGRLHRLHRGVFAVGHEALTPTARSYAAVCSVDGLAGVASLTALAAHGIRPLREGEETVHLVTVRARRARDEIRFHGMQSLTRADLMVRDGVLVLTPALALLTAANDLDERALRRAVNQAFVMKLVSVPLLVRTIAEHRRRRGVGKLGRVLAAAKPTRSEFEDAAAAFFDAYGMERFEMNARAAGREVDVLFPRLRLVIELDSAEFHDNPIQRADDAAKQTVLERAGFVVARLRWHDVTADQPATATKLDALGVEVARSRESRGSAQPRDQKP